MQIVGTTATAGCFVAQISPHHKKIMNRTIIASVSVLSLMTSFCQAAVLIENFDSYSNGTTASAAGWIGFSGSGLADWAVKAPSTAGDPSAASFARGPASGIGIIDKPFSSANPFSSIDTIYYEAWVRPQGTGGSVQRTSFGVMDASASAFKGLFGVSETGATFTTFKFFVANTSTTLSTSAFSSNSWYQLQLVVDQSAGSTNETGSLYVRNVTAGETSFTAVAGLQNINLGLTSTTEVVDWGSWAIQSSNRQEIDNLSLSNVPEPSSLLMLGMGAGIFLHLRRRRS